MREDRDNFPSWHYPRVVLLGRPSVIDESGQPVPISESRESGAPEALNSGPSSGGFVFDPEIDDPYRDVLFEFIIAGTWEKALGIIYERQDITGREAFWTAAKEHLERCGDERLRDFIFEQCIIAARHLAGDLSADERARLDRFPKQRAQGDLAEAHRIYSGREAAIAAADAELEKRIVRDTLAIDPCATPLWFSLAALAHRAGDEEVYDRCLRRFVLALMSELDIGLFALRHGVQKVARSNLEACLSSLADREFLAPTVAVSALTALASIHSDLAQYDGALGYVRRACEIAQSCNGEAEEAPDQTGEPPFNAMEVIRLRTSLAYATIRAGRSR